MNKSLFTSKKLLYLLLGLAIPAITAIKLYRNKQAAQQMVYEYQREAPIGVEVDTVHAEKVVTERTYSGTYEPIRETKLSAEWQGKVNAVLAPLGSRVTEGQVLITLDNALLNLQLQAVEVQIQGLEADVSRYTVLVQAGAIQGVQLEKAELGLQSAKVQRATLMEQIHKTSIRAPFSGVVTAQFVEVGAFAAPGVPLLQISDIHHLKFIIQVSETHLGQFEMHAYYPIRPDAYTDLKQEGKASMIGSKSNMGNSFTVEFLVANTPDLRIRSGMFGKVALAQEMEDMGMAIPTRAVLGTAYQPQVYVVRQGKAVLQQVTLGNTLTDRVLVTKGLQNGDILVTSGFINLFDGAHVAIN
jgi:RND family efflux transporter MFP subunit